MTKYVLRWDPGPLAGLELFSPEYENGNGRRRKKGSYSLKYTAPYHSTIRPPSEVLRLTTEDLQIVYDRLSTFTDTLGLGSQPPAPLGERLKALETLGQKLYFILPDYVTPDLELRGLFVELGLDKQLLALPWELMFYGESFLCLNQAPGRFVNSWTREDLSVGKRISTILQPSDLSILIVCVPAHRGRAIGSREPLNFEFLPEAQAECSAILDYALKIGARAQILQGPEATVDTVERHLRRGNHTIVHFCGHAQHDERNGRSSIVLHDGLFSANMIFNALDRDNPPVLCFVNGCDSAKRASRHDIFDLASAFLRAGTYLIGSRWRLSDSGGRMFASEFYRNILQKSSDSIGTAIMKARNHCHRADDLSWTSYVFYGDPRVRLDVL